MDNNQPQSKPVDIATGTNGTVNNGNDEYSTPIPQGATVGGGMEGVSKLPNDGQVSDVDEYSTPIPQGAVVGNTAPTQTGLQKFTSGLEKDDDNGWESPILGNLISGGVKSAAGGLGNILDMINHPVRTLHKANKTLDEMGDYEENGLPVTDNTIEMQRFAASYKAAHPTASSEQISQALTEQMNKPMSTHIQDAADWLRSSGQPTGFWQNVGAIGEQILEWIGTEGVAKLASAPAKVGEAVEAFDSVGHAKQTAQVAQVLQANPKLAGLVAIGAKASQDALKFGAGSAAQEFVHTEDPDKALQAGVRGAIGGGLVSSATGVLSSLLAKGGETATTAGELADRASTAPTADEAGNELADLVNAKTQPIVDEATSNLTEGQHGLDEAHKTISDQGINAPENSEITAQAQEAAKNAHDALGTNYQKASDSVKTALKGTTVEYGGSPLHQAAQDLLNGAKTADAANPLNKIPPATLESGSPKVQKMLETLADNEGEFSLNDEGEPTQLTADNLLDKAKQWKEELRKVGWATSQDRADRDIYFGLLDGLHDTLQQIAEKSGNPEAINTVEQMNSDYKNGINLFKDKNVKALLSGNGKDVAKRLLSSGTSLTDLQPIKSALGETAFNSLIDSSLKSIVNDAVDKTTGEFNFNKFLTRWNQIPSEVRREVAKNVATGTALQDAVTQAQKIHASGVIPEATAKLKDVADTVQRLIGNGDTAALVKDTPRVKNLASVLGPDGMSQLGKTILDNQLRTASTDGLGNVGNVDTGKFLNWVKTMKDSSEVVDALFKPTPESAAAYNKLIADASKVQSVKNLVKFGVLPATIVAGGPITGHPIGAAVLAAIAAGSESAPAANRMLENIANSPRMWNSLKWLNEAAGSDTAKIAATAAKFGASKTLNAGANLVHKKAAYNDVNLGSQ